MINTKNSKKKRIGLILCSLFVCLCSILCIVPFNKDNVIVKADTITNDNVVFNGSSLIVPTVSYPRQYNSSGNINHYPSGYPYGVHSYANGQSFSYLYTNFNVSFRYNQDNGSIEFNPWLYSLDIYDSSNLMSNTGHVSVGEYVYLNLFTNSFDGYQYKLNGTWFNLNDWSNVSSESSYDKRIIVTNSSGLSYLPNNSLPSSVLQGIMMRVLRSPSDIDISKISYMTIELVTNSSLFINKECQYKITYYDSSSNYIQFVFFCGSWSNSLPSRTYYFNTGNFTDSEWYDQGYQQGQQAGYNTGYSAGETAGYNAGYSVGNDIGYNNGFSDGVEDSNQYTFLNLLSATIDAPVKYFQSLFNFELLGVNLQGFLTGLFTLCIIVTIVKLCLGGI